jgi:aromatic-L-amino-acid decarboxylase
MNSNRKGKAAMDSSVWQKVVDEIEAFQRDIRALRVNPQATPEEIRAVLEERYDFRQPVPLENVTSDVMGYLRDWNMQVTHPRYFGLFNPSVQPASIIADTLTALYNPQMAAWSHAPAANELERLVLRCFSLALGFDPQTIQANFTTGGAEANLSAVVCALAHAYPDRLESGRIGLPSRPAIYLSGEAHHSFLKIARITGLGTAALREIPTDDYYLMDVAALTRQIQSDQAAGWQPLMIVGTAGTTGAGLIDPLPQVADVAARFGAWFHVDAAWGGSAALSPRLRPFLSGIQRADSVTWDAHKWLSVPMGAGMFFTRHPEAARQAFAITATYMPQPSGEDAPDPYTTTIQWSRRAIGLKVFMALAELGLEGYAKQIEGQAAMGDWLRTRLQASGWTVRNQAGRITIDQILERIYARGKVWISAVVLGGRERVLRACITSFHTQEEDVECLLDELEKARGG